MSELKPCPFCGGEAVIEPIIAIDKRFYSKCRRCGCAIPNLVPTEQEAAEAWNARAEKMCYVLDYRAIPDEGSILCRLSCDHEVLIPDLGPFNPSIEYCPYCAAKVMNNDNRHD